MKNQLIQQCYREAEGWKRSLEFLQSENAYIKNRIAEIAQAELSPEFLFEIENFQNRCIREDELLKLARLEVIYLQNHLENKNHRSENTDSISQVHKSLKDHIEKIEVDFNKVKTDFNLYLKQKLF